MVESFLYAFDKFIIHSNDYYFVDKLQAKKKLNNLNDSHKSLMAPFFITSIFLVFCIHEEIMW